MYSESRRPGECDGSCVLRTSEPTELTETSTKSQTTSFHKSRIYVARLMDLEKAWADFLAAEGTARWAANAQERRAEMRRALDAIRTYRALDTAAYKITRQSELATACDEAWSAEGDARTTLMLTPAPDAVELLHRLRLLHGKRELDSEPGEFGPAWRKEWHAAVMADAERLLGREEGR